MSRVDSRYVNWTVVFTETGTFNLAVNVTDRYNGVTYVKRTHVDITVFLLMPWDITGPTMWVPDDKCDMSDVALIAKLFGSVEGDGKYDSRADITGSTYLVPDGKIDMSDVALAAKHYGEIY